VSVLRHGLGEGERQLVEEPAREERAGDAVAAHDGQRQEREREEGVDVRAEADGREPLSAADELALHPRVLRPVGRERRVRRIFEEEGVHGAPARARLESQQDPELAAAMSQVGAGMGERHRSPGAQERRARVRVGLVRQRQ